MCFIVVHEGLEDGLNDRSVLITDIAFKNTPAVGLLFTRQEIGEGNVAVRIILIVLERKCGKTNGCLGDTAGTQEVAAISQLIGKRSYTTHCSQRISGKIGSLRIVGAAVIELIAPSIEEGPVAVVVLRTGIAVKGERDKGASRVAGTDAVLTGVACSLLYVYGDLIVRLGLGGINDVHGKLIFDGLAVCLIGIVGLIYVLTYLGEHFLYRFKVTDLVVVGESGLSTVVQCVRRLVGDLLVPLIAVSVHGTLGAPNRGIPVPNVTLDTAALGQAVDKLRAGGHTKISENGTFGAGLERRLCRDQRLLDVGIGGVCVALEVKGHDHVSLIDVVLKDGNVILLTDTLTDRMVDNVEKDRLFLVIAGGVFQLARCLIINHAVACVPVGIGIVLVASGKLDGRLVTLHDVSVSVNVLDAIHHRKTVTDLYGVPLDGIVVVDGVICVQNRALVIRSDRGSGTGVGSISRFRLVADSKRHVLPARLLVGGQIVIDHDTVRVGGHTVSAELVIVGGACADSDRGRYGKRRHRKRGNQQKCR